MLNIGAGVITNYGTLSVSNLNILSPGSEFNIYPGQTLGVKRHLVTAGSHTAPAGATMVSGLSSRVEP